MYMRRLGTILRDSAIERLTAAANSQDRLLGQVRAVLPPDCRPHCVGVTAKVARIVLFVDTPTWVTRLRFQSQVVLSGLQAQGLRFSQCQVRVLAQPHAPAPPRREPQPISAASAQAMRRAAEHLDPELRDAFLRLARHSKP